jgi:hypothetical protein
MTEFNEDEFLRGQQDCKDGKPHLAGQSSSYDRGYSTEYQHEQNISNLTGCNDEY